jgi:PAS domain S-box-containing protein
MAFIPLVSLGRVIGKFMLYYPGPHDLTPDELHLASVVAFAVERTRAEAQARRSEERLRFALDAAAMGTWDWDLVSNHVTWSDNVERLHGLPAGWFDGTFASYEREIHPDDRQRVLESVRRAIERGVPHDVEYRIVAPDGTVRWVEGKGRVDCEDGRPARMTGVCVMTTRRKEAELARLRSAEEANRLKDEFLATLSHELRTPLNAILGWVQILQSNGMPVSRAQHALDIIGRNAQLQAQLIEDILDVSRIISGKLEIDRTALLLDPLIETAIGGVQPAAEAKGIRIVRQVAPDLPPIEGDAKRLQQVLGNVLSNAVKFTPTDGRITVRCAPADDGVRIEVDDTGAGIDPDFLPCVFDRFRQADSRTTRRYGGLGLGLAIARHLIDQHRGEIAAHSDGPGLGTRVTIRLPSAAADLPRAASIQRVGELRLESRRVIVVDDQHDSRELIAVLLGRCGAEVLPCAGAADVLVALRSGAVDLLVADIAMPDVDGYDLIEQVRRTHPALAAIAVSAYARPEDRRRALGAGYDGYTAKPIDANELFGVVRDVLDRG